MVDMATIQKAVELLREAAQPSRIILFGSYATGEADDDSDVDLLVVEDGSPNVAAEMVRLVRVLSSLRIPADLIVVSQAHYEYWRQTPGNLMFEVAQDGKVLYEAA
jgi:predicted nucleotidyltransferase